MKREYKSLNTVLLTTEISRELQLNMDATMPNYINGFENMKLKVKQLLLINEENAKKSMNYLTWKKLKGKLLS